MKSSNFFLLYINQKVEEEYKREARQEVRIESQIWLNNLKLDLFFVSY